MRYFMDSEEEVLIRRCTDHICRQEKPPGEHGSIAEKVCAAYLQRNDTEDHIFRQWLGSAELGYLVRYSS
jgi:hypothetical protein